MFPLRDRTKALVEIFGIAPFDSPPRKEALPPPPSSLSSDNPYQPPETDGLALIQCQAAKAKIAGTRSLGTTHATIHPVTGEIRFAIVPEWAFPVSILLVALSSLLFVAGGLIAYALSYSLIIAFASRPVSLNLAKEDLTVDTRRDFFALKKKRDGRDYSLAFQITPQCYRVLPQLAHTITKTPLKPTHNLGWHTLAVWVIVGAFCWRFVG